MAAVARTMYYVRAEDVLTSDCSKELCVCREYMK